MILRLHYIYLFDSIFLCFFIYLKFVCQDIHMLHVVTDLCPSALALSERCSQGKQKGCCYWDGYFDVFIFYI